MVRKFNRRSFLRSAGLAAAGSVLAACAPAAVQPQVPSQAPSTQTAAPKEATPTQASSTQTAAPKEATPTIAPATSAEGIALQYWVAWSGDYVKAWDQMQKTDEYKEIMGNNVLTVKGSMYAEAFLPALAAGNPPDLGGNGFYYLDYMARGVLQPIDDLVAISKIVKKEDFIPGNWESSFYKGAQYGVPANECFERDALVYNSSMVEKAGLDPKTPPVTWAEVLDWHKKLTKFDSAGNLTQIGLDPYDSIGGSMNPIDGFFAGESWGFTYFDQATSKFDLDNDKMANIFDTYAEFYKVVGPDKMAGMRSVEGQGTWGGSYFAAVQAMVIDGYWHCQWTEQAKPEVAKVSVYTWAPVTEARRGVKMQYPGGHLICLFKDSKHHTEAFKVAEFLQTKSACDILFDLRGFLPARPAYLKTVDKYTFPGLDFFFNSLDEATEWEKMVPCVIADFVQNQFNTLGESVYRGNMDSKAAVAQMQKACTEEWQKTGLA